MVNEVNKKTMPAEYNRRAFFVSADVGRVYPTCNVTTYQPLRNSSPNGILFRVRNANDYILKIVVFVAEFSLLAMDCLYL